jgi:hypothetical protein
MSSSKNTDLQKDFATGIYLSEEQNPIRPHLYNVYVYLFKKGGEELY